MREQGRCFVVAFGTRQRDDHLQHCVVPPRKMSCRIKPVLFLAPSKHSILKSQVFGLPTLHSPCNHILSDLMERTDFTENNRLTDDEFMIITRAIYGIDNKTKSVREAKLDIQRHPKRYSHCERVIFFQMTSVTLRSHDWKQSRCCGRNC